MKNRILSIVLFCLIFFIKDAFSQQGWFIQQSSITSLIKTVHFVNPNTGYAAGGNILIRTTNGGIDWISATIAGSFDQLSGIFFLNPDTGFIAGSLNIFGPAVIMKTTNGGSNWESKIFNTVSWFSEISFFNSSTGIVVGGNGSSGGVIFRTTDSGKIWEEINNTSPNTLLDITMLNEGISVAVGYSGSLIRSNDFGRNWKQLQSPINNNWLGVSLTKQNTIYITGDYGKIYKSENDGITWSLQESGTQYYLYSILFINESTGWITSDGSILRTTNSGVSWNLNSNFASSLLNINFLNSLTGYIVGAQGKIYKTTNAGGLVSVQSTNNEVPVNYFLYQNFPNPFNPTTTIRFDLKNSSMVVLSIYDMLGKEISKLVNQVQSAGQYEVPFNASNLSSGIYYYKFSASPVNGSSGDFTDTKKMILIK